MRGYRRSTEGVPFGAKPIMSEAPQTKPGKYNRLLDSVDPMRRSTPREIVSWVFEALGCDPESLDPDNVPSPGAVKLLQYTNEDFSHYEKLLDLWGKLLPTKGQLDNESHFQDDGRKQLELLEAFESEMV